MGSTPGVPARMTKDDLTVGIAVVVVLALRCSLTGGLVSKA
jgi:hypothetical protein